MHDTSRTTYAFIPTTIEYAKAKAKLLRKLFPEAELSLARAQQLTARAMGHADWHALDRALKEDCSPAPAAAAADTQQKGWWQLQMAALIAEPKIPRDAIPFALLDWSLTGPAKPAGAVSENEVAAVLSQLWPTDDSALRAEVRLSVAAVVHRVVEHLELTNLLTGKLRTTPFAELFTGAGGPEPFPLLSREPGVTETVESVLKGELLDRNENVERIRSAASIMLLGPRARFADADCEGSTRIREELASRLYTMAISQIGTRTLWELFFAPADEDGLVRFRNTREAFQLDNGRRGDNGEFEGEVVDPEPCEVLPPHARLIQTTRLRRDLELSILQKPTYNQYSEQFRVTNLAILVRNGEGDNVAFADARLYESGPDIVSKDAFWDLADSEDIASSEMAETLLRSYPRFTRSFAKGSYLYIEELELAKKVRGGACSALLVEAIASHCEQLGGPIAALCVDVRPPQFPSITYQFMPEEIKAEARRVNGKLRARALDVLARPALAKIPTKLLRFQYPTDEIESV